MRRLLLENLGWKLVSLAVAALLWFVVVGEPQYSVSINAPLEYSSIPRDLEISAGRPETVSVELEGPSGQLDPSHLAAVSLVLDLSSVSGPCERTFTLGASNLRLPSGVRFVRAVPSQVRLLFERRATRSVPVRVRFSGTGYYNRNVLSRSIEPDHLRVVGPESHVSAVEYAETDVIDLSGITGERTLRVGVFVNEPQVRFESSPEVNVKVVMVPGRTGGEH
jgi:YbbR domain-containing protein